MLAEDQIDPTPPASSLKRIPWFRIIFSFLVGGLGLWFIAHNLSFDDIAIAFRQADFSYVLLGLVVILLTMLVKTWRWQYLFAPRSLAPPFPPLFWSLILGQFVNVLIPVRLGEVVRIYDLDQRTHCGKARSFGTLVIEKTLDITAIIASTFLLLPYVVIPGFITERAVTLAVAAGVIFAILFLVAFQTQRLVILIRRFVVYLPASLQQRVIRLFVAGLDGLSALRDWRLTLIAVTMTAFISLLSILTPLVLFPAFDLPVSVVTAVLLNIVLSIGSAPPSTPGKILIFEGLVIFTLFQLGLTDNAVILSYAIVYHLVVIGPQLVLGTIAMAHSKWHWPIDFG